MANFKTLLIPLLFITQPHLPPLTLSPLPSPHLLLLLFSISTTTPPSSTHHFLILILSRHICSKMLTCIPCSHRNQYEEEGDNADNIGTPNPNKAIKSLTTQIKDMALKASGTYRHCKPSSDAQHQHQQQSKKNKKHKNGADSDAFRRTTSLNSMPRVWGKEMESRLKGLSSSSEGTTPSSLSGRVESIVFMEEEEEKEWIAQVEPGVLITFVSLRQGGNDLKRIRFSREMFNKWQAQRWWAENFDKVMELYNVQRFNHQAVPLPTPPRSSDENSKIESVEDTPMTPPLSKERLPRNFHRPMGMGYSSSDSLDHHPMPSRHYNDSIGQASTPKLSSISGTKTETSSMDASIGTSSSNRSGELSISNASDVENEWDEQDEPGVFITIRSLPGGTRELRRVRFSRERFGEMHARLWWEENRARIHEQYLNL